MPKIIHTMIRVLDPERSKNFYREGFGFAVSHQLDFPDFTLVYLRSPENDFEIELTHNHDRTEPYTHGDGYGHYAFVTDDLASMHAKLTALGHAPAAIKEFKQDEALLAQFFFVVDPDGYKIEVLEKWGHYH
ncbi:VOC family protein [Glaciimonas sp. CA11.2]|uniref:VOC family protein n=1 Tax=Glaciimonas sp. CA11.2 TaxID=3048601 RepID=UPI002AB453A2|nr:VOC family protein [Glaciimonas sp. CA11.2]MDY7547207.1 VOC family protein [Glaciimonas sp. CA11.2]MEB0162369.1 VOC family protein [Glaciimonas sp. CA11.2]